VIKRDCLFFGCQIMEELYMKYRAVVMCVIVVCVIVVCVIVVCVIVVCG